MPLGEFTWLAVFVVVMLPVWALFLYLRSRIGANERAWELQAASHETPSRGPSKPTERDPTELPGHCTECGEPTDDYGYERCWNCGGKVNR